MSWVLALSLLHCVNLWKQVADEVSPRGGVCDCRAGALGIAPLPRAKTTCTTQHGHGAATVATLPWKCLRVWYYAFVMWPSKQDLCEFACKRTDILS